MVRETHFRHTMKILFKCSRVKNKLDTTPNHLKINDFIWQFELMSEKGLIIFGRNLKTPIIVVRRLLQCVKSYSIMNDT